MDSVRVNDVIIVCFICSFVFSIVLEELLTTSLQTFASDNVCDKHEDEVDPFNVLVSCEVVNLKINYIIIQYYNCKVNKV